MSLAVTLVFTVTFPLQTSCSFLICPEDEAQETPDALCLCSETTRGFVQKH